MREMKDSGIKWMGKIPAAWKVEKVKHGFLRKKEEAHQENPVVLSLARAGVKERDISNNEGQIAESYYNYNPVDIDDLLINPMDLYSGANCSISKIKGVISPAYVNLRYLKGHNPNYYDYYFKIQYWMMAFFAHGKGVSFENRWTLNAETLMNYPIITPSEEEQNKIVNYLNSKCSQIDSIIEKQQAIIEKLKEYKLSVITEAVTKGLNPDVKMKNSGNSFVGLIPKDWQCVKVKNIASVVTDGAHISPETDNGVYDFVSTVNVEQDNIHFEESLKTSEESYLYLVKTGCKPQKGDVLISKDGSVGRTAIVLSEHEFVVSSSLVIIRPIKEIITSEFLNFSLQAKYVQDTLIMLMHGAGLKRVSVGKNANLPIILPALEEQEAIVEYLTSRCDDIVKAIRVKENIVNKLQDYKESLIYEVVTGKKEV